MVNLQKNFFQPIMTHAQLKYIQSLSRQKYRKAYNAYLVEGNKNAKEWLTNSKRIKIVVALPDWIKENHSILKTHKSLEIIETDERELKKISALNTPQSVLLVVDKGLQDPLPPSLNEWSLYLQDIRDPGNMGTIIRIADWFGIKHLFYTGESVEIFNPKVVQATMGSLLRINLSECNDDYIFSLTHKDTYPLYATYLHGENLLNLKSRKWKPGVLAMGNESKGLTDDLVKRADFKLKIEGKGGAESLNVAIATGIFCSWLT